jgi:hypothetical protein
LWSSDIIAERIEDLQFSLNEGACMQAAITGAPVLVPDLGESTEAARWPIFAAAVAEQTSVRALFASPLQWGPTNLGVLDLYRRTPGSLSQAQWRDALSAAEIGSLLMLNLRTDPDGDFDPAETQGWLDPALGNHRAEVHQATGMVLVQPRCRGPGYGRGPGIRRRRSGLCRGLNRVEHTLAVLVPGLIGTDLAEQRRVRPGECFADLKHDLLVIAVPRLRAAQRGHPLGHRGAVRVRPFIGLDPGQLGLGQRTQPPDDLHGGQLVVTGNRELPLGARRVGAPVAEQSALFFLRVGVQAAG